MSPTFQTIGNFWKIEKCSAFTFTLLRPSTHRLTVLTTISWIYAVKHSECIPGQHLRPKIQSVSTWYLSLSIQLAILISIVMSMYSTEWRAEPRTQLRAITSRPEPQNRQQPYPTWVAHNVVLWRDWHRWRSTSTIKWRRAETYLWHSIACMSGNSRAYVAKPVVIRNIAFG